MSITYSFNKILINNFIILCILGSSIYATEIDNLLSIRAYHQPAFSLILNENQPFQQGCLIEIESEDLNDRKLLEVKPNVYYAINLGGENLETEILIKIQSVAPYVYKLSLFESNLDNDFMKILPFFSNLAILDISHNYFDDIGMQHLANLANLIELNIVYNKITSKGLQPLLSLTKLQSLDAGCTYVGNDGVRVISQSKSINSINLRACGIDDEAFPYLNTMSSLKKAVLSNNIFSHEAKEKFMKSIRSDLQVQF